METTEGPMIEKKRILIIDDEASFTRLVKLNLEKGGRFEVRTENRAISAVASAREFHPDLILLDVIMPGIDGGDVSRQLKADRFTRGTPIIFLTATVSRKEAGEGGFNSGGDLFLAKPVSTEKLIECIDQHLRKTPPEASIPDQ